MHHKHKYEGAYKGCISAIMSVWFRAQKKHQTIKTVFPNISKKLTKMQTDV